MSDSAHNVVRELPRPATEGVQAEAILPESSARISVQCLKRWERGACMSNVALGIAKSTYKPPRVLGEAIPKHLRLVGDAGLAEVIVAGPGSAAVEMRRAEGTEDVEEF